MFPYQYRTLVAVTGKKFWNIRNLSIFQFLNLGELIPEIISGASINMQ